jgi:hypothetical protein
MGAHGAIHRFADPTYLQSFDQKIRDWNGALASTLGGTLDKCGWPKDSAQTAPKAQQSTRGTTPLVDDFSAGLDPSKWVVGLQKGCCAINTSDTKNKYSANLFPTTDTIDGVETPVFALRAWAVDNPACHDDPANCHKDVVNSGTIASAELYASGRYSVVAKVANASGLIWALWTFHYEEHLPSSCADSQCWCSAMPNRAAMVKAQCEFRITDPTLPCKYSDVCDNMTDGWPSSAGAPAISPEACGALHASDDPQFLGNDSIAGWVTTVNHEIDIEIPANCEGTANVCNVSNPAGITTCTGLYNSANFNNYIYTQGSGTGPAYSNMCVRATQSTPGAASGAVEPFNMVGDGKYHNYTIVWHSGDAAKDITARVEFWIDSIYMGTNNAFVVRS